MAVTALRFSGVQLLTPLGDQAAQIYSALQAGLSAYQASPWLNPANQPMTVTTVPDACLAPLHSELQSLNLQPRQQRIVQLAARTLGDCVGATGVTKPLPMVWVVPEKIPGFRTAIDDKFIPLIAQQAGVEVDQQNSYMIPLGRAGLVAALQTVQSLLDTGVAGVFLGAVDSFADESYLRHLDEQERIMATGVADGFAPGEGAAVMLVSEKAAAQASALRIAGVGSSNEPGHRYSEQPYTGEALSAAVQAALASPPRAPLGLALTSLNGESFWAKEWSLASFRARSHCRESLQVEHPATGLGDLGAATGLVQLALAEAYLQHHPELGSALLSLASELATRAALVVEVA